MDPMELPLSEVIERVRRAEESRHWTPAVDEDGNPSVPDDEREVLVFLNGHVGIKDMEGRQGGGWGIRFGWHDHVKGWFVSGQRERFVTHWMELPAAPGMEP